MTKQKTTTPLHGDLVSSWMNMATSFWDNATKMQDPGGASPESQDSQESRETKDSTGYNNFESWQTTSKNLASFLKLMTSPENQGSVTKGMGSLYEMLLQMSDDSVENTMEFQEQFLNTMTAIGQRTKPYNFEDIDHNMFESFRTLYEQEFQKYLQIPQLGLPRFYQEGIATLVDKFNLFHFHLSELGYLFSVPIEKTNRVMQDKMEGMLNKGEFFDDTSKGYDEWVKILEGHYMVLLKSPKYTQVLKETIDAMAGYRNARDEVLCHVLKLFPIPTNREMDEVYKELHTLKKQLKALSKEIAQLKGK
ncbi:MAG: hypothetical protein GY737_23340 [Desulfobacteraceae bacterium]|nr:hypothetical protein [Desulfobacteraceae bacterium]